MSAAEDLFCPHVEVDWETDPDGASCLPCARAEEYDPDAYETDAEWRERLGIPPLQSPSWFGYSAGDVEAVPGWTCRGCGNPLPEESTHRREWCGDACRKRTKRRKAKAAR